MLAAFLTTVLFSISAVCGRRAVQVLGGTEANFWRLCFATLLLATYAHGFGYGVGGTAFPIFLFSGCVGFGVGDAAMFQAFPRLGSRLSVMLVTCLSSPIAALIEWLWLGTELTRAEILCALTILGGVAIALAPSPHLTVRARGFVLGIFCGSLAAFCQAYGAVLSRKAFAVGKSVGENIDGITAAYQRVLGGIAVTALLLVVIKRRALAEAALNRNADSGRVSRIEVWRRAGLWVLLNGLSGPALGVSCYQWALKNTPTGVVLPIVAITPLVIVPFARYFEGERPTWRSLVGGVIAVIGAVALARCQ